MKKSLCAFLCAFFLIAALSASCLAFGKSGSPGTCSEVSDAITAAVLEEALSLPAGSLRGVTVSALPDPAAGRLVCEGVAVEAFDYLPRESLDWLVFESYDAEDTARVSLFPDAGEPCRETSLLLSCDPSLSEAVFLTEPQLFAKRAEASYFKTLRTMCSQILP